MNTSTSEQVRASNLIITEDALSVALTDGRMIIVPLVWFPKLLHATEAERNQWQWIGEGQGIHWPLLDEDLSVTGFLQGTQGHRDSARSANSLTR
jgi:hypothetical protein